jgi:hypothetical protein
MVPKGWKRNPATGKHEPPHRVLTDEQRAEVDRALPTGKAEQLTPGGDGAAPGQVVTEPATGKPRVRPGGLFGPRRPREPRVRATVALRKADNAEGLGMVYEWVGSVVADREEHRGGLGSVGRSMRMTAPTAGRLLAEGAKRFPGLHNLLASILGTGAGVKDASAVIGIPILVRRMERDPGTIPGTLPLLRAQMRPILRDMLKAARDEEKVRKELAELESELTTSVGRPFTIDHLILCDMLGLSTAAAEEIIKGGVVVDVIARHYPRREQPPEPEPQPEPVQA